MPYQTITHAVYKEIVGHFERPEPLYQPAPRAVQIYGSLDSALFDKRTAVLYT